MSPYLPIERRLQIRRQSPYQGLSHTVSVLRDLAVQNRVNAMLYKVRDFVNANILKSIYYALFESHINYACIIWEQNISTINHLYILQKKALRIINFKEHNAHSSPLFHYSKIIKIADKVKIENCLFINKCTNNKLPSIFTNWFTFSSMSHNYQTSCASKVGWSEARQNVLEKLVRQIQKNLKSIIWYSSYESS